MLFSPIPSNESGNNNCRHTRRWKFRNDMQFRLLSKLNLSHTWSSGWTFLLWRTSSPMKSRAWFTRIWDYELQNHPVIESNSFCSISITCNFNFKSFSITVIRATFSSTYRWTDYRLLKWITYGQIHAFLGIEDVVLDSPFENTYGIQETVLDNHFNECRESDYDSGRAPMKTIQCCELTSLSKTKCGQIFAIGQCCNNQLIELTSEL